MDKYIIDRIENGIAVCETGGIMTDIPLTQISGNPREGDILIKDESAHGYTVDADGTEKRRAEISARFNRIKKKGQRS